MKRKRLTKDQIICASTKTGDLARKHKISEATLYNWKATPGESSVAGPSIAQDTRERKLATHPINQ